MMLTARLKSCAAAAVVLAACLLLPNTPAKAEAVSLPEPEQTAAEQPAPKPAPASAVLTPLAYEATVTEILEEPAEEPEEEAPAEEAEEAEEETVDDSPIAQATKADMQRPDDLVKLGDFIATAYCVTGQTSTGTQTTVGRTLAVNPYVIPYGTEVWLYLEDGTFAGDFIAEDTGSNMLENPNVIDIYMGTDYDTCIEWGVKRVRVYVEKDAGS